MEKLSIVVDREATADEMESVRQAFSGSFDVQIDKQIVRLSAGCELPLLIDVVINVGSDAIYAGLALSAVRLFADKRIKRKVGIVVRHLKNGEQIILSKNRVALRRMARDTEFPSIEALLVYLKER